MRYGIRMHHSSIASVAVKGEGKIDIEYSKMEREVRDEHRIEIIIYLHRDTELLWKLCVEFVDMFGVQLTIGGTAMKELRKTAEFTRLSLEEDKPIRERYFYGGRVECFESGIIEGAFQSIRLEQRVSPCDADSIASGGKVLLYGRAG